MVPISTIVNGYSRLDRELSSVPLTRKGVRLFACAVPLTGNKRQSSPQGLPKLDTDRCVMKCQTIVGLYAEFTIASVNSFFCFTIGLHVKFTPLGSLSLAFTPKIACKVSVKFLSREMYSAATAFTLPKVYFTLS